jgi:hypothetical protein
MTFARASRLVWIALAVLTLVAMDRGTAPADERATPAALKTQNVILITYDGLRWQEVFGGADDRQFNDDTGGVKNVPVLRERFWRDTPEERRATLLPFFWSTIATQGQVFGDPAANAPARVTNDKHFSYPGYNEILTGVFDPRIDSNDKRPNPNETVLEWLHKKPAFEGRIASFTSWDVFPFIVNDRRSGIPVNAGWQPLEVGADAAQLALVNEAAAQVPHIWEGVRDDYFTFVGAREYLLARKPRVMYISFGETDDWAHGARYDQYLDSALRTDGYISRLWETAQSLPEYAGRTTFLLTTDHGRGDQRADWQSHKTTIPGCDMIWVAALGPDTEALGVRSGVEVTQSQVAATVAALLGEDYHAAVPKSGAPLPGVVGK